MGDWWNKYKFYVNEIALLTTISTYCVKSTAELLVYGKTQQENIRALRSEAKRIQQEIEELFAKSSTVASEEQFVAHEARLLKPDSMMLLPKSARSSANPLKDIRIEGTPRSQDSESSPEPSVQTPSPVQRTSRQ
mmetsp:Transcript_5502/g.8545  ORF Transcript_5502/g.8545 Transcript_5502/m.8545 type:complete len:135 (+) Transcript_5502:59-463(+)